MTPKVTQRQLKYIWFTGLIFIAIPAIILPLTPMFGFLVIFGAITPFFGFLILTFVLGVTIIHRVMEVES